MNDRLIELYTQRGRLRERIAVQRGALARDLRPLCHGLHAADRLGQGVDGTMRWVAQHPLRLVAALGVLALWRPAWAARLLRTGWQAARTWSRVRGWFK